MAAISKSLAADPGRVLVIERTFEAPRDLIFRCWSEPDRLVRWIGPQGFTTTILTWELRQGGSYRLQMRGPDGQTHWQQGVFVEIVPPERIVRTFCWADAEGLSTRPETLLTVTFADLGGRTRLTLQQAVFESVTARDAHHGGWSSSLEQFAGYLATL
jgi:uncharacterized protein YndB with AHSA1/START domain